MKRIIYLATATVFIYTLSFAGPADKIIEVKKGGSGSSHSTVIENSKIKNKSNISGSQLTNIGIDQKNVIHSVKIRKGSKIKNTTIHNKAKMSGTKVTNVGIGQDNNIGSVDIGDTETK